MSKNKSIQKRTVGETPLAPSQSLRASLMRMSSGIALVSIYSCSALAQTADPQPQPVSAPLQDQPAQTRNDAQAPTSVEAGDLVQDVITVTGRRRDAELAIEAKRNAKQIVDALSADNTSRLPDNNIAESLGRIPGVSFRRNRETGNGDFVSVRGLDSSLVNVQFNGVNSGLASGGDRRVPLDGITSDDIAEIRVAKSLLPQDEGEGIGGSVNITQRTPLLRGEDDLRFNASVRPSEFADTTGFQVGARGTKVWGDTFGISLSASFRRRFNDNFLVNGSGSNIGVLPDIFDVNGNLVTPQEILDLGLEDAGNAFDDVTAGFIPDSAIVFEERGYEYNDSRRDQLTISGAIDWRPVPNTLLTLGGRYSRRDSDALEFGLEFDEDDQDFELIDGQLVTDFNDPEIDVNAQIEDQLDINASAFLKGVTELENTTFKYQASYARAENSEPQTELEFTTGGLLDDDDVTFQPFSFSDTFFAAPNLEALNDPNFVEAVTNFGGTQQLSDFEFLAEDRRINDRFAAKFDIEHRLDWNLGLINIASITVGGKFERSEVRDTEIEFADDSEFLNLDGTFNPDEDGTADGASLNAFDGLFTGEFESLDPIGAPLDALGIQGIPRLDETAFRNLNQTFEESFLAADGEFTDTDFLDTNENVYAGYVQSEIEIGKLTLTGGVRVEYYDANFTSPLDFDGDLNFQVDGDDAANTNIDLAAGSAGQVFETSASNTEVLPRLGAIYRPFETFQIRGGVGLSVARPTFTQLGRATDVEIEIDANVGNTVAALTPEQVAAGLIDASVEVESGNPDLNNSESLNLDLSFEYFPFEGTAFTVGFFYKDIDDFIFIGAEPEESDLTGIDLADVQALLSPEDAALFADVGGLQGLLDAGVLDFDFRAPLNGESAQVKGVEIGVFHQLNWAPSILSDMGFFANVTFTDSDATIPIGEALEDDDALVALGFLEEGDIVQRETSFFNAPDITANASVFYEANGLEVALSGSFQTEQFDEVDDFGLDQFSGRFAQLDLFIGYELPWQRFGEYEIFFQVSDLTDTGTKVTDLNTVGRNRNVFDEGSFNGREFEIGVRARF